MALKSRIPLGMSLPHRSPDRIDMPTVSRVAQRAEALGFRDLWVTENTMDHVFTFDAMMAGNPKHAEDALIAATAVGEADVFVTNETRLASKIRHAGFAVDVWPWDRFVNWLGR